MLNTDLYTVASGPSASGDLSVPDPSPAEAEKAISINTLDDLPGIPVVIDGVLVPAIAGGDGAIAPAELPLEFIYQGLDIPPEALAETQAPKEARAHVNIGDGVRVG